MKTRRCCHRAASGLSVILTSLGAGLILFGCARGANAETELLAADPCTTPPLQQLAAQPTTVGAPPASTSATESFASQAARPEVADQDSATSHLEKARFYFDQNQYREAQAEFQKSLDIERTPEAYFGLGQVSEILYGIGSGKKQFEEAVKLDPNSAMAHRQLGIYFLSHRELTGANHELSTALVLDPSDGEASRNLIGLWQGQVAKAPSSNAHFGLARAYQLSGALDSAQSEYREVARLDPNNPYLPAARQSFKHMLARQEAEKDLREAETLEKQGRLQDAYQLVAQALVYSPGNTEYKLYQAELLTEAGQPGLAKQIYLNVLREEPENQTAMQCIQKLSSSRAAANMQMGGVRMDVQAPAPNGNSLPAQTAGSVSGQPPASAGATTSDIAELSTFLTKMRQVVFDQKDHPSVPELPAEPVSDPAGMLHGLDTPPPGSDGP